MLDTPGTNHLARHPCTRKNGCVAIAFEPDEALPINQLADWISAIMQSWCPTGSDPGLCVAEDDVPREVIEFGRECQRQLVSQVKARDLAKRHGRRSPQVHQLEVGEPNHPPTNSVQ